MEYTLKILKIEQITHNVWRYTLEKPDNYKFTPGQVTNVSINLPEWKNENHPFTLTSLNSDEFLEFTIKSYPVSLHPNHSGMTEKLSSLKVGDELIITDAWGNIHYKGKGIFLAGGAGVTPFIAILKVLKAKNELSGNLLIFSNSYEKDIILKEELLDMFKDNPENLIFTLTKEEKSDYHFGRIDEKFLKENVKDFSTNFYICGPRQMVKDLSGILANLGAAVDSIVFES